MDELQPGTISALHQFLGTIAATVRGLDALRLPFYDAKGQPTSAPDGPTITMVMGELDEVREHILALRINPTATELAPQVQGFPDTTASIPYEPDGHMCLDCGQRGLVLQNLSCPRNNASGEDNITGVQCRTYAVGMPIVFVSELVSPHFTTVIRGGAPGMINGNPEIQPDNQLFYPVSCHDSGGQVQVVKCPDSFFREDVSNTPDEVY